MRDDALEPEVVAAARREPEIDSALVQLRATAAPMPRLAPVITAVLPQGSCRLQRSKCRVQRPKAAWLPS